MAAEQNKQKKYYTKKKKPKNLFIFLKQTTKTNFNNESKRTEKNIHFVKVRGFFGGTKINLFCLNFIVYNMSKTFLFGF